MPDQLPEQQSEPAGPAGPAVVTGADAGTGEQPGPDQGEPDDPAESAAAAALARARAAARGRGLRPGRASRPARRRAPADSSGIDARDPALLGDQVERLLADRGWQVDVAVGSVLGRWPSIVGPDIAGHCEPTTFQAGVLTVRADSTAWATQLRLISASLLQRLQAEVGDAVAELRVVGPGAPSWGRGRLRTEGRGPRDTYG